MHSIVTDGEIVTAGLEVDEAERANATNTSININICGFFFLLSKFLAVLLMSLVVR